MQDDSDPESYELNYAVVWWLGKRSADHQSLEVSDHITAGFPFFNPICNVWLQTASVAIFNWSNDSEVSLSYFQLSNRIKNQKFGKIFQLPLQEMKCDLSGKPISCMTLVLTY